MILIFSVLLWIQYKSWNFWLKFFLFNSLNSQQQTSWLLLIEIVIFWYVNWLSCGFLRKIDKEMLIVYFKDAAIFLTYFVNRAPLLFCICNFGHLQGYSQALLSTTVLQKNWVFLNSAGGPGGAVSPPGRVQGLCPWKLWLFWLNWGLETCLRANICS